MAAEANGPDVIRIYTNLVATLESEIKGEGLGELLARLRGMADGIDPLPELTAEDDLLRALARIGIVDPAAPLPVRAKTAEAFVREVADRSTRTSLQILAILRIFSGGMYGVLPQAVCGAVPRCKACKVTKDCDFFNAPRKINDDKSRTPMKKLESTEYESLSEEDLLCLLIGGSRITDAIRDQVKKLLEHFGSLRRLANASYPELIALRGMSESVAARLATAFILHKRTLEEKRPVLPAVRSGKDFYDLYHHRLRDLKKEEFYVILLDQRNRILRDERVAVGTLTNSLVHPREVLGPAMREAAAAVAFVHNHPSGDSTPSPEDIVLTKRLCDAAKVFGIRVLDHVVIGDGTYSSFVDDGKL